MIREENPYLGGDLDMGTFYDPETLELIEDSAKACGLSIIKRKVKTEIASFKITLAIPIDIHVYRPNGNGYHTTGTGFLPDSIHRYKRRLIHDYRLYLKGRGKEIDQGSPPYRPIVWEAPSQYLGIGKRLSVFSLPKEPEKLLETHYGPDWRYPNKEPWVWYESHLSSYKP